VGSRNWVPWSVAQLELGAAASRKAVWWDLRLASGWLVGWGLTALLTQNRSYRACRFVGIFYSKL